MSTISAGTTSTTTLIHSGDTTGSLVLKTNDTGSGGTTAVTIGTDQSFNFSATGQRITGDFSNATFTNRVSFQSSTTNGATVVQLIPNGTSTSSQFSAYGGSDILNTSVAQLTNNGTEVRMASGIFGTGTYLPMTFYTGGSERMRVDTSGNVGIGTSSPAGRLNIATGASTSCTMRFTANNTGTGAGDRGRLDFYSADNSGTAYQLGYMDYDRADGTGTASYIAWANRVSGTVAERMRIDSSGNLLVGTTSSNPGIGNNNTGCTFAGGGYGSVSRGDTAWYVNYTGTGTGQNVHLKWQGTTVGNISTTSTATAYNTSSDYRLKHDIAPMAGALAKVAALKPVTYKWSTDNSDGEGFIAHELAEVCPHAVTGEKDAVDAEGNPIYQSIDTSFLVATLTAAIQEQQALIQQLQADVAALKGV